MVLLGMVDYIHWLFLNSIWLIHIVFDLPMYITLFCLHLILFAKNFVFYMNEDWSNYLKCIWGQVQGFSRSPKILGSPSWSVSVVRDSQCWDGSYMMQQGTTEPPWSLFPIWCILIWKWKFAEIWTNWGSMGQLFHFLNLECRGDWRFYCINLIVTRRWHAMLRVQRRHDWLLLSDFNWENHSMLPTVSIDILALFPTWQCATRSKWHKDDLLRRRELQKTHTSSSSNLWLSYTLQKSTNMYKSHLPVLSLEESFPNQVHRRRI